MKMSTYKSFKLNKKLKQCSISQFKIWLNCLKKYKWWWKTRVLALILGIGKISRPKSMGNFINISWKSISINTKKNTSIKSKKDKYTISIKTNSPNQYHLSYNPSLLPILNLPSLQNKIYKKESKWIKISSGKSSKNIKKDCKVISLYLKTITYSVKTLSLNRQKLMIWLPSKLCNLKSTKEWKKTKSNLMTGSLLKHKADTETENLNTSTE